MNLPPNSTLPPFPTLSRDFIQSIGDASYGIFEPLMTPFEAALRSALPNACNYVDSVVASNTHEFSKGYPLANPYTVLFSLVCYITALIALIAVSKVIGKLELRAFGIAHNLFLTVVSAYMCLGVVYEAYASGFPAPWNNAVAAPGVHREAMGKVVWVYYASKVPEFIDTFLMALKHNYRQITFLHVYHHCSVLVICFLGFVMTPGGDLYWGVMLNSGVHVPMYAYYMLNLLFPTGPVRTFLNRYKFFITYGQITQFVLIMSHALYCGLVLTPETRRFSYAYTVSLGVYAFSLLVLFLNFLIMSKFKARQDGGKKPLPAKKVQ
jgi:elongation of very long chain fatty acids protein 4